MLKEPLYLELNAVEIPLHGTKLDTCFAEVGKVRCEISCRLVSLVIIPKVSLKTLKGHKADDTVAILSHPFVFVLFDAGKRSDAVDREQIGGCSDWSIYLGLV